MLKTHLVLKQLFGCQGHLQDSGRVEAMDDSPSDDLNSDLALKSRECPYSVATDHLTSPVLHLPLSDCPALEAQRRILSAGDSLL